MMLPNGNGALETPPRGAGNVADDEDEDDEDEDDDDDEVNEDDTGREQKRISSPQYPQPDPSARAIESSSALIKSSARSSTSACSDAASLASLCACSDTNPVPPVPPPPPPPPPPPVPVPPLANPSLRPKTGAIAC